MKINFIPTVLSIVVVLILSDLQGIASGPVKTVCNPMDLSYRFMLDQPSRREAADPTMVLFRDTCYLFASKSGGYWYSADLKNWTLVSTSEIPTEEYAPTVVEIDDTLYFLASSNHGNIYKTGNPKSGKWKVAKERFDIAMTDPDFFLDDDKRLYFYWGCSDRMPIWGTEIDYKRGFKPIGQTATLISANTKEHGWEVPGDYNTQYDALPWIEGSWMNKHDGKYYLQYAGPGTQFRSYSDGVYVSDNPLGPFRLAENNPFAYRPGGFVTGAGHGSTFADKYGNYWHIGTVTISVKHMFERRLALFPTFFDQDGVMYTDTRWGDYPMIVPDHKLKDASELFPGWMLLSYGKKVEVSSSLDGHAPELMTDEDIRTYWSAKTGSPEEWVVIDLGADYDVYALQINFAEQNTTTFGRKAGLCFQYTVEASADKKTWKTLVDKTNNQEDNSHAYLQLDEKASCRYLRLKNKRVADGTFALSGFRVFGKGSGSQPIEVKNINIAREEQNRRTANLTWKQSPGATGYIVSFGPAESKQYQHYMVYGKNSVSINSLNTNQAYWFSVTAFNENGVTEGKTAVKAE